MGTKIVGGLVFGFVLFFTSYFGTLFMIVPFAPLIVFAPHVFRSVSRKMTALWLVNTVALLEQLYGIKIVISGDSVRSNENSLILMNHRTRLDWMFFWSVIWRQSSLALEKIILKTPLKRVPGAGWAMQFASYIFVDRNWEKDQLTLRQYIDYLKDTKQKNQILLFPEGTDFTAYTKRRSDEFAKKNGLEPYEYVLHPRTTGFTFMAQYMRKEGVLDAVYDVTLAYPHNLPQDEKAILRGEFPTEIHFHVKRHRVQTLPISEDGLKEWCNNKWKEKEEVLRTFYTSTRKQLAPPVGHSKQTVALCLALLYWTVFMVSVVTLLYWFSFIRWYVLGTTLLCLVAERVFGGFELFQINMHSRFWRDGLKAH